VSTIVLAAEDPVVCASVTVDSPVYDPATGELAEPSSVPSEIGVTGMATPMASPLGTFFLSLFSFTYFLLVCMFALISA
jgi:hypothetical protein